MIGDVDACRVYAFGPSGREPLPQQTAHDVGRPSSRARSQHDSVGDSEIGAVLDGTSSGAAGGGASYYITQGSRRGYDPPNRVE